MNKNWPFDQVSNPNDKLFSTMKSKLFLIIIGDTQWGLGEGGGLFFWFLGGFLNTKLDI